MPDTKQSVTLSSDLVLKIQRAYMDKKGTARGAMQDVLSRGAELALAELTGNVRVESSVEFPYNSVNATEIAAKILQAVDALNQAVVALRNSAETTSIASTPTESHQQRFTDKLEEIHLGLDDLARSTETLARDISTSPSRKRLGNR